MVTLLKSLKHDISKGSSGSKDTAHAKSVQASLDSSQKLVKQGSKVNMEAAKEELLEAALAVKRGFQSLETMRREAYSALHRAGSKWPKPWKRAVA